MEQDFPNHSRKINPTKAPIRSLVPALKDTPCLYGFSERKIIGSGDSYSRKMAVSEFPRFIRCIEEPSDKNSQNLDCEESKEELERKILSILSSCCGPNQVGSPINLRKSKLGKR